MEFDSAENAETAICTCAPGPLTFAVFYLYHFPAKFTGYQYGGRPLGLTYVKYTNVGSGDAMEGTEATGGLTQDQIM